MKLLDLFSGVGGFSLAATWAWGDELEIHSFVEIDKFCQKVLKKHWPNVPIHDDIRTYHHDGTTINLVCGGDPCPIRSRARSILGTKHPDLSGYFLAVVGRCRPKWVVRENVPASDDKGFCTSLEMLGYRSVIISTNAATITGQSRNRDFIVGSVKADWQRTARQLLFVKDGKGTFTTRLGTKQIIPCLTTHRTRYDSRDCYIWNGRLRILDGEEREAFAGFPAGWTSGFSEATRARMMGNSIVPQVVYPIMQAIKEAMKHEDQC